MAQPELSRACAWEDEASTANPASYLPPGSSGRSSSDPSIYSTGRDTSPRPVDHQKTWRRRQAAALAVAVPPPNIGEQLLRLLETEEGADVTFRVGRREFAAHTLVLSARSPVLRATLSDEQQKKNPVARRVVVRVDGVAEAAFEALLHFAYADALPAATAAELLGSGSGAATTVRARMEVAGELIAAADRFGMERMRLLCERALCEAVADEETAAATLVLADRLECQQLKAFCVGYIAEPGVLKGMVGTDAYMSLKESCPGVLLQIMEKIVAADVEQGNGDGSSSPAPGKRPEAMHNIRPSFQGYTSDVPILDPIADVCLQACTEEICGPGPSWLY